MVDGKLKFTVTKYFNGYPSYDKSTPLNILRWIMIGT